MGRNPPASQPPASRAQDAIPAQSAHRPLWKYILVAVALVTWLAALAGLHLAAR